MQTKILACKTLEDELVYTMKELGLNYEILWIESGLHDYPDRLHDCVQDYIDELRQCDRLLLVMGRCGNSIHNIQNGDFELILPKVEDCISLLFGSDRARNQYTEENACFYLTDGWMRGERNVWTEYQRMVEKYGEELAAELADMMYGNYRSVALLDTEAISVEQLKKDTEIIAQTLNLEQKVAPATLSYMEELLTGPWTEDRYIIVKPHEMLV